MTKKAWLKMSIFQNSGAYLKQKQQGNEEPLQFDSKRQEQVFWTSDSSSEYEPLRMTRTDSRIRATLKDFKVEVPEFEGKLDPEEFLDWRHMVERVFEYKDIPEEKKVKLVALRLRKYASLWWTNLCAKRDQRKEVQNQNMREDEIQD